MARARCRSRSLNQWVRFRRYRGRWLVGFLPSGKIVFADRDSEVKPRKPGAYFAALIEDHGTTAFVRLIGAHRSSRFRRHQALGPTKAGKLSLSSYSRRRGRKLPFVCKPDKERLELLGFDTFQSWDAEGRWEYYEYRHGRWRLLNYFGPCKMTDEAFADVERRVREFERTRSTPYFGSPSSIWSDARRAGVVTDEEEDEARRRSGPGWYYAGD